jgi:hypothetical protein
VGRFHRILQACQKHRFALFASPHSGEKHLSNDVQNGTGTPPISWARKLIGFPIMAVGALIIMSPLLTSWLFANLVSPIFLKWQMHAAVALFGGGLIFGTGAVIALGWEVVRKWRASRNGFY